MEITFEKVVYNDFDELSFKIKKNQMNGISGDKIEDVFELLKGNQRYLGDIYFNKKLLTPETKKEYQNLIAFVPKRFCSQVFLNTVEEYISFTIKYKKLQVKDPRKKVVELLQKIGFDESYLDKKIEALATSEKRLVQIIVSLLSNPKVLVLEEMFSNLDLNFEKKLIRFLNYLIDNEEMTIVLISKDSECLYRHTKHVALIKDNKTLVEGNTSTVYKKVKLLESNGFEVPDIVLFTYKANKQKKVKLSYHKDIRDLIKDVYKNV